MPTPVGTAPVQKLEVEFVANTWTDVSAGTDVETLFAQLQIHYGRTSQFAQPGPASLNVTLKNPLGRYTPQRQVLTDGVTPHPFWPNVVPRKRIRFSYTVGGVTYYRFWGYIKGFPPSLYSGVLPVVPITATDRMDQLSRVKMQSPLRRLIAADSPTLWWPLDDEAGSTQAVQAPTVGRYPLGVAGTGAALTFGSNGPGVGDGTGVNFAAGTATSGQYLAGAVSALTGAFTVAVWFNMASPPPSWVSGGTATAAILGVSWPGLNHAAEISVGNGFVQWNDLSGAGGITPAFTPDGGWHLIVLTRPAVGSAMHFFLDDVDAGAFGATGLPVGINYLTVGNSVLSYPPGSAFVGNIGQVTIFDGFELTAAQRTALFQAGVGFTGDTTDARIARYLGFAGLTATDWTLDAGQTTVGTYPQAGKDVVSACQDMAITEGGGAAFWVRPSDGDVRFPNRRYRDSTTPVLILDASIPALLDPDVWDPAYDETTLINTSTVSRSAESGTLSTQIYQDPVSAAPPPTGYGESDQDVTTYTQSDTDALNLAQSQVAGNAYPAFRLNQLAVNFHAATSSLYAQLAAVEIGSRIRVINIPPAAAPMSTLDLFVEGWTEYPNPNTYRVVFDTSPVVAGRIKIGDATYGKLGCDGQTLSTALPNSAATTNVVIATSGTNPTFSTVAGEYPATIKVGEEVITLTAAPGGSTSPQTFTGCLRGQQGTFPAAQAAGSVVTLWPRTGLAL